MILPDPGKDYQAHRVLVEPAKAKTELWRIVFGLFLIVVLFFFFSQMLRDAIFGLLLPNAKGVFVDSLRSGSSPGAVLFILLQLALLIPATAFAAYALHKRSPITIIGPVAPAVSQFMAVLAAQAALALVVFVLPPYGYGVDGVSANLAPGLWLVLLPIALPAILLQCGAEEYLFRGYLQSQLAARFRHPAIWMGLPSLLFGLGHYMPATSGENAIYIAALAGLFGLIMADLTARSGTLGPAIAVHLANNASAILFFAPAGDLTGLALYTLPFGLDDTEAVRAWLPVDLAFMLVSWLAARLVLRR